MALFLMRGGSASSRYAASCAGLVILVLLPVVTACILYQPRTAPAANAGPASSLAVRAEPPTSETVPAMWLAALQPGALPLWSLGVFAFSLRLVLGSKQVATLRRRGVPA